MNDKTPTSGDGISADEAARIHFQRIVWQSRRGMLELDLVLEPFVKQRYLTLEPRLQQNYVKLLDCQDQQLFNWFLKKEPIDDSSLREMVGLILDYHKRENRSSPATD